jgi:hypothetical protein
MPQVAVALIAAVATAGAASILPATILGYATLSAIAASVIGSVVAYAASMVLGAVLGTGVKAPNLASAAQDRKQVIRQSIAPRQVVYGTVRVGGVLAYSASTGDDKRFFHMVVILAGHPIEAVDAIWINDQQVSLSTMDEDGILTGAEAGQFDGKVRVRVYLGDHSTADPDLIAESPDGWSADHKLLGCAYIYLRLEYSQTAFPSGLQSVGATIRGRSDVYDPRDGGTSFSNNWALCVLDYLRSGFGMDCADDEIDFPSFIAAANLSDELVVALADGSTQTRFATDTAFKLDRSRRDILRQLLSAGAGTLVYVQGKYRLHGGAYTAPTDTLTISDLAGDVRVTTRTARRDQFNAVKGTFIDPFRAFQAAEFPAQTSATFEAEDGERIWRDLEFPATTASLRAQQLALMELRRGREALAIEAPVQYRGLRYAVWQMLSVTIPDLGLTAQPMRIIGWSFGDGIITLRLRIESAGAYAWTFADGVPPTLPA